MTTNGKGNRPVSGRSAVTRLVARADLSSLVAVWTRSTRSSPSSPPRHLIAPRVPSATCSC
jgi:hypothetical protein